jgi:hypothetical protein
MSTRANYVFELKNEKGEIKPIYFYIHTDGYPSGVAEYFKTVLATQRELSCSLLEAFVCADIGAELRQELSKDIDYCYTIDNRNVLTVDNENALIAEIVSYDFNDCRWIKGTIFDGTIQAFIDKYGREPAN